VGLIQEQSATAPLSKAYLSMLERAIMRARQRGSLVISIRDFLLALLDAEPNVSTYLLVLLGVNLAVLRKELDDFVG
jgi:hypothetical protein